MMTDFVVRGKQHIIRVLFKAFFLDKLVFV